MSANLLPAVEITTAPTPTHAVIWMHGLGPTATISSRWSMNSTSTACRRRASCFPHAPQRPVTINGGYIMRAWYDILSRISAAGARTPAG